MKTIVWDIDDVLNELMRTWFEDYWSPAHPETHVSFNSLTENPPDEILRVTKEDYLASLDSFRLSNYATLRPSPQALEWFLQHGRQYRNIALSLVPARFSGISASWVFNHFGSWIRSFNFVPSPRADIDLPIYDSTKADFLKWLGRADILIDDNERTIAEAEIMGLRAFLVKQPWNSSTMEIGDVLTAVTELGN